MKKYLIIFLFTLLLTSPVFAEVSNSTGFLPGQIWYSKDSLVEGEIVKIYTAVWNGDTSSLSAKVEFYDKNVILGTRDIIVPALQLQEVSVSWKVTSGDHIISAKILSSTLNTTSGGKETVVLENNTTNSDKKFVPVVVKKEDGKTTTGDEVAKDELGKVGEKINEVLPDSVSESVSSGVASVETFRENTLTKISDSKEKTAEKIEQLKSSSDNGKPNDLESATEKPIAQQHFQLDPTKRYILFAAAKISDVRKGFAYFK